MRILMNFLKKNWRLCFGCYIFIYLPWFFYLEKKITMETPNLHIINNAIDDMIPFCVYFIIPYMLWFIYVIGACIYMLFKGQLSWHLAKRQKMYRSAPPNPWSDTFWVRQVR